MQHVHFSSCGCGDESKGNLDLYSLNESISRGSIQCLNEKRADSIRDVICNYENRFGTSFVTPEDDNEIIVRFTFNEEVKLKGLLVRSQYKSKTPKTARLYINPSTDIDFSNVNDFKPTQLIQLQWDPKCEKPVVFRGAPVYNTVNSIALYISDRLHPDHTEEQTDEVVNDPQISETGDQLCVNFLGFLGNFTNTNKRAVKAIYEAAPVASDHAAQEITRQSLGFGL